MSWSIKEESAPVEKTPVTQYKDPLKDPLDKDPLDKDPLDKDPLDKDPLDKEFPDEEIGQPSEDYSYRDEEESVTASRLNRGRRRRPKKSGLMVPVLLVTAAIAIVAGGFLIYKLFFSPAQSTCACEGYGSQGCSAKGASGPSVRGTATEGTTGCRGQAG